MITAIAAIWFVVALAFILGSHLRKVRETTTVIVVDVKGDDE